MAGVRLAPGNWIVESAGKLPYGLGNRVTK
jgi:hypothetical protein